MRFLPVVAKFSASVPRYLDFSERPLARSGHVRYPIPMSHTSPIVKHISWGRTEVGVQGQTLVFKDCKLWPGGAAEWDWNETGTHHTPGIQPADVQGLLAHDPDVVILSRGMQRRLQTAPETEQLLQSRDISYEILETNAAIERFNALAREGRRPAALIHSTC